MFGILIEIRTSESGTNKGSLSDGIIASATVNVCNDRVKSEEFAALLSRDPTAIDTIFSNNSWLKHFETQYNRYIRNNTWEKIVGASAGINFKTISVEYKVVEYI